MIDVRNILDNLAPYIPIHLDPHMSLEKRTRTIGKGPSRKDFARELNMDMYNLNLRISRGSVPYEEILDYCIACDIPMKTIFTKKV